MSIQWKEPVSLYEMADLPVKRSYLASIGYSEDEISEKLAADKSGFSDEWCDRMRELRHQETLQTLISSLPQTQAPRKSTSALPWSAIVCSGISGIARTMTENGNTIGPVIYHVFSFLGLVLFVRWVIRTWKAS